MEQNGFVVCRNSCLTGSIMILMIIRITAYIAANHCLLNFQICFVENIWWLCCILVLTEQCRIISRVMAHRIQMNHHVSWIFHLKSPIGIHSRRCTFLFKFRCDSSFAGSGAQISQFCSVLFFLWRRFRKCYRKITFRPVRNPREMEHRACLPAIFAQIWTMNLLMGIFLHRLLQSWS